MAEITRDQFDETKNVLKKIYQKGTYFLDSDINEMLDVITRFRQRFIYAIGSRGESRYVGTGFNVVGTGASLAVTVKAGTAVFVLDTGLAEILYLDSDTEVSGFNTWSSTRTDYVYIDIHKKTYDTTDDVDIINPLLGIETCNDVRLDYSFAISQGSAPGSPPADHYYITIGTVTKDSGSVINSGDVSLTLEDIFIIQTADLEDDSVTKAKLNSDVAGTGLAQDTDGSIKINAGSVVRSMLGSDVVITTSGGGSMNTDPATNGIDVADGGIGADELASDIVESGGGLALNGTSNALEIDTDGVLPSHLDSTVLVSGGGLSQDGSGALQIATDGVLPSHIGPSCVGDGLVQDGSGALEVEGIVEGGASLVIKKKVISIGTWDMDTVASVNVAHGLSQMPAKVRNVSVVIIDDTAGTVVDLYNGGDWSIGSTNVTINRDASGFFDGSTSYDDTASTRGWITIEYYT